MFKSFPEYVKLLFISVDGICSFAIFRQGVYWVKSVPTFLISNILHLSTIIIKPAHDDHFVNASTRYWLSLSRVVKIAVSSANCSQCFGGIQP